jgi:hypothetical protein
MTFLDLDRDLKAQTQDQYREEISRGHEAVHCSEFNNSCFMSITY